MLFLGVLKRIECVCEYLLYHLAREQQQHMHTNRRPTAKSGQSMHAFVVCNVYIYLYIYGTGAPACDRPQHLDFESARAVRSSSSCTSSLSSLSVHCVRFSGCRKQHYPLFTHLCRVQQQPAARHVMQVEGFNRSIMYTAIDILIKHLSRGHFHVPFLSCKKHTKRPPLMRARLPEIRALEHCVCVCNCMRVMCCVLCILCMRQHAHAYDVR